MQDLYNIFIQELALRLPDIFWVSLILIFGLIVGDIVKRYVVEFLDKIRLNQMIKSLGWEGFFDRFNAKMDFPLFLGTISQVYFFLLFLSMGLEVLDLDKVNSIVIGTINYYPNIFVSMGIFIFAVFLNDLTQKIVVGRMDKESITYSNVLGKLLGVGVWIQAVLAILYQLHIVRPLILSIFIGVVSTLALSIGIAFGLGAKDAVAKMLKDIENRSR